MILFTNFSALSFINQQPLDTTQFELLTGLLDKYLAQTAAIYLYLQGQ